MQEYQNKSIDYLRVALFNTKKETEQILPQLLQVLES